MADWKPTGSNDVSFKTWERQIEVRYAVLLPRMRCIPGAEAIRRVKVALAAAEECYEETGREIMLLGRTDVRNDASMGSAAFEEALYRTQVLIACLPRSKPSGYAPVLSFERSLQCLVDFLRQTRWHFPVPSSGYWGSNHSLLLS